MQHNENANPPTLFLALESLMSEMERQGTTVRNALAPNVPSTTRMKGSFLDALIYILCLVRVRRLYAHTHQPLEFMHVHTHQPLEFMHVHTHQPLEFMHAHTHQPLEFMDAHIVH